MKRYYRVIALVVVLLMTSHALALNRLVLPNDVFIIEEEAFMGVSGVNEVILPEGVMWIDDRAFKGMNWLQTIYIPESVSYIGTDALDSAMDSMLVECAPDSYAMWYAQNHCLDFNANTTCRALLVGNEYPDSDDAIQGPYTDVDGFKETLDTMDGRTYEWTWVKDCSSDELDGFISDRFGDAQEQDISLFFFSGHGSENGSLLMADFVEYTPQQLKDALDRIKGRKLVIVDACFSGRLIDDGDVYAKGTPSDDEAMRSTLENFQKGFLSSFKYNNIAKGLFRQDDYFVMTSSRWDQESENYKTDVDGDGVPDVYYGLFVYNLCRGLGYDFWSQEKIEMDADVDHDMAVSMQEAYEYADNGVRQMLLENGEKEPDQWQQVQMYPEDCRWFAPFRNKYDN